MVAKEVALETLEGIATLGKSPQATRRRLIIFKVNPPVTRRISTRRAIEKIKFETKGFALQAEQVARVFVETSHVSHLGQCQEPKQYKLQRG